MAEMVAVLEPPGRKEETALRNQESEEWMRSHLMARLRQVMQERCDCMDCEINDEPTH